MAVFHFQRHQQRVYYRMLRQQRFEVLVITPVATVMVIVCGTVETKAIATTSRTTMIRMMLIIIIMSTFPPLVRRHLRVFKKRSE